MILDIDTRFEIAAASPLLDRVEAALRTPSGNHAIVQGHPEQNIYVQPDATLINALIKFQQDCGLEIDRDAFGPDENNPAPTEDIEALRAAYVPTSPERFFTLMKKILRTLPASDVKEDLNAFLTTLPANVRVPNLDHVSGIMVTAHENAHDVHRLINAFAAAGKLCVEDDMRGPPHPYMTLRAVFHMTPEDKARLTNLGAVIDTFDP